MRDLADLLLQLLDALVDLRLVQPELQRCQRCHRSGLLRRGRRTRLRIGTPLCIRLALIAQRFAGHKRHRWLGLALGGWRWARRLVGRRCGHICQALLFSLPLRVHTNQACPASLWPTSVHSPRSGPSASEIEGVTTERMQQATGAFGPEAGEKSSAPPEISGQFGPSLWHPRRISPHRFTPQTDGKTDFAGFCPLLTSHSPVASVYCQRSALGVRSRRRQCHCLRRSWHDVEGSQKIASQTPIDVYSGDKGAHPKPA